MRLVLAVDVVAYEPLEEALSNERFPDSLTKPSHSEHINTSNKVKDNSF